MADEIPDALGVTQAERERALLLAELTYERYPCWGQIRREASARPNIPRQTSESPAERLQRLTDATASRWPRKAQAA